MRPVPQPHCPAQHAPPVLRQCVSPAGVPRPAHGPWQTFGSTGEPRIEPDAASVNERGLSRKQELRFTSFIYTTGPVASVLST
jgi:hypothetical protein